MLTPEGRSLLHDARSLLIKANTLRARARGLGGGVELKVSIALDPQFPLPVIAAALRAMQQAYPTVGVETWTAPLGAGIAALREKRCTLAITAADLPDQAIDLEFLCNLRRAAVAAPHHPLADAAASGARLMRHHLADHIQIVVPDPSRLTAGQDFGVLSPGTWRASDNESKRALIIAGTGWGSLPLWLVAEDLAAGRLVRLPIAEFGAEGETTIRAFLGRRADDRLGPAGNYLAQQLRELAAGAGCAADLRHPASDTHPSLPSGPSRLPDQSSARGLS